MAVKKKSNISVRVLNAVVIVLVLLSLLVDGLFIYYKFFNQDITIGVNYVGGQLTVEDADNMSGEQLQENERRTLLTANLYSNNQNNGVQLEELQINYYTDYRLQSSGYRSSGMQYIGDVSKEDFKLQTGSAFGIQTIAPNINFVDSRFYYYDKTNGVTGSGYTGNYGSVSTPLKRQQALIVSIDGEPYAIQLDKYSEFNRPMIVNSKFYATWGGLFQSIMKFIVSSDKSYGDYYITLDLSDFFSIKKYDINTGKFLNDDVTDIIKNYAVLKYHYDANGAVKANQSIFGSIECNNSYGMADDEISTNYWQERITINLTESNLKARYSEVMQGNYLSLDTATKIKLSKMNRVKVNVTISVTDANKIIGLDYNAFKGLNINELTILGTGTFTLLENSLVDTNVQTIRHASTITLDKQDNATSNEYVEVEV